jgi:hypothetical protein
MNRVPLDLESTSNWLQIGLATEAILGHPVRRACQGRGVEARQPK